MLGTANWQSYHFLGFTRISLYHISLLGGGNSPPEGNEKILSSFRRVRALWFCLISNILTEKKIPGCKIDTLVKLLLSSYRVLHLLAGRVVQDNSCSGTGWFGRSWQLLQFSHALNFTPFCLTFFCVFIQTKLKHLLKEFFQNVF